MMELITNRTEADVLMGTARGTYSFADLNRVETAVKELSEAAKELSVHFMPSVKTDWAYPGTFSADTWPTQSQMLRYLDNVKQLCQKVGVTAKLPSSMENLNWKGANQIEEALSAVNDKIENVIQGFQYSGEIFAGEENVL